MWGGSVGFEGNESDVQAANDHYDHVAELFGIDRNFVHSWHAGIHPGCSFEQDASENYERWSGAAFGNPRLLHFHTCGNYAPGEISWNIVDPTVIVDGIKIWEDGVLHAERLKDGQDFLDQYPTAARIFKKPDFNIGLPNL